MPTIFSNWIGTNLKVGYVNMWITADFTKQKFTSIILSVLGLKRAMFMLASRHVKYIKTRLLIPVCQIFD